MLKNFIAYLFMDSEIKKIINFLRQIPMFSELTNIQLKKLNSMMHCKKYLKGEKVYQNAESAKLLCVLVEGSIEVTTDKKETIKIETPGYIFGHKYIFCKDELYTDTVKCLTDSKIFIIHKYDIEILMKQNSDIGFKLSSFVLKQLYGQFFK